MGSLFYLSLKINLEAQVKKILNTQLRCLSRAKTLYSILIPSLTISPLVLISTVHVSHSKTLLKNCFEDYSTPFFILELESVAQENNTPILLFNEDKQVVGLLSVSPQRESEFPHKAKEIIPNKLSLCTSELEVSDFYYTDGDSSNLTKWFRAPKGSIQMTQPEALIVLEPKIVESHQYAHFVRVTFLAYDVFKDEKDKAANKKHPDYLEDWGLPRGKGTFYLYIPSNWEIDLSANKKSHPLYPSQ